MALIKCPECKKEISDKAKSCPHCGNPMNTKKYCPQCGKEMKTDFCTNCGYPKAQQPVQPQPIVQPVVIQPKKKDPNDFSGGTKAWLVLGAIFCFIIALVELIVLRQYGINFFGIHLDVRINFIFILDVLLGMAYINIKHSKNRLSMLFFYIINLILIVYFISQIIMSSKYMNLTEYGFYYLRAYFIADIIYLICAVTNTIITSLAVKGKIKKDYKASPAFIILNVIGVAVSLILSLLIMFIFSI